MDSIAAIINVRLLIIILIQPKEAKINLFMNLKAIRLHSEIMSNLFFDGKKSKKYCYQIWLLREVASADIHLAINFQFMEFIFGIYYKFQVSKNQNY